MEILQVIFFVIGADVGVVSVVAAILRVSVVFVGTLVCKFMLLQLSLLSWHYIPLSLFWLTHTYTQQRTAAHYNGVFVQLSTCNTYYRTSEKQPMGDRHNIVV